jgi:hypothetical protein
LNSKANLSGANFTGNVDVAGDLSTDGLTVDDTTGTVVIDAGQFVVRNPDKDANIFWSALGGDSEQTAILGHGSGTKLQTTATGIDVTGDVSTDTLTIDGTTVTATAAELNYTDGVTSNIQTQLNGKATSAQGALADSAVQPNDDVSFGTGSFSGTLESTGYFSVNGTVGNTGSATDRWIGGDGTTGTWFYNVPTGSSHYFAINNSNKLAINGTGVDVTGTVTADGLTVDGVAAIQSTQPILILKETDVADQNTRLRNTVGDFQIQTINDAFTVASNRLTVDHATGNVSFYEDTGTTAKFVWDASAESLSIGDNNSGYSLNVGGISSKGTGYLGAASPSYLLNNTTASTGRTYGINSSDEGIFQIYDATASYATRFALDSSGNVGIGTASPSKTLTVVDSDSVYKGSIKFGETDSYFASIVQDAIVDGGVIYNSHAAVGTTHGHKFHINGTERARIDSSGRLGIGTASPSAKLDSHDNSASIRATRASNTDQYIELAGGDGSGLSHINANYQMAFKTGSTERARIDSSGNLLVGTTNTAPYATSTETGVKIFGNGTLTASTSATSAILNTLNDGTIINFRKDGSTVGSIGTNGNHTYFVGNDSVNGSGCGLLFEINTATPVNRSGTPYNGLMNLGSSSNKFRDLYLDGGVYLGGTGAANKLDDYEEGIWTPTLTPPGGTITLNTSNDTMRYTKIGNMVTVTGSIRIGSVSSPTGNTLFITGLPFTRGDSTDGAEAGTFPVQIFDSSTASFFDTSTLNPYLSSGGGLSELRLGVNCALLSVNDDIYITATYFTA